MRERLRKRWASPTEEVIFVFEQLSRAVGEDGTRRRRARAPGKPSPGTLAAAPIRCAVGFPLFCPSTCPAHIPHRGNLLSSPSNLMHNRVADSTGARVRWTLEPLCSLIHRGVEMQLHLRDHH